MHVDIAQNRADLTYAFKIAGGEPPDTPPSSTLYLTVRNFKKAQATSLCRMHMYNH